MGAFMPIASAGSLYVNIGHVGGITYLLYLLPLAATGLGIAKLYKDDIKYLKIWFISIGIITILITMLATFAGILKLRFMIQNNLFINRIDIGEPVIGLGSILLLIGNIGIISSSFRSKSLLV